ncbi:MAG: hypothetical protein JWP81_4850 [Ferruginibacter sp.]|nr:hypothetical protein [Ferruginibacter sp.]
MRRFSFNQKSIVMKKLVIVLTVAVMLFSAFAFATDSDKVNYKVKASFSNDFATARNVSWEKTSDFYFAAFTINNMEVNAAYNEAGELVGTSRNIESSQLPISVSLALTKRFNGYEISKKALELNFEGETRYYITVANERQALKLKCSINGNITVERKVKK